MVKKEVDYKKYLSKTMEAFSESRVLLASQPEGGTPNVMAIGWGTIGTIWSRPVFIVMVRPSRYTYQIIEETGEFTVNVAPLELKEKVAYCGSISGRNSNKFQETGLTPMPAKTVKTPLVKECHIHFECRVLHKNNLLPSEINQEILSEYYSSKDFHRVYFGQILACLSTF